jgi:hypothetical protein
MNRKYVTIRLNDGDIITLVCRANSNDGLVLDVSSDALSNIVGVSNYPPINHDSKRIMKQRRKGLILHLDSKEHSQNNINIFI